MIVIYPEKFKGNQVFPQDVEVRYRNEENWTDSLPINGLYSTVILSIKHKAGHGELNYKASFLGGTLHVVDIDIDCNYHSQNLDYLIDLFYNFEEIL